MGKKGVAHAIGAVEIGIDDPIEDRGIVFALLADKGAGVVD
jgi:hypothetical protein